eukprot:jgi/Mesvir1/6222/Mv00902-RA.1
MTDLCSTLVGATVRVGWRRVSRPKLSPFEPSKSGHGTPTARDRTIRNARLGCATGAIYERSLRSPHEGCRLAVKRVATVAHGLGVKAELSKHETTARKSLFEDRFVGEGGAVALGKFDALHIGHRSLACRAAQLGDPWLLSFTGMAEVLGWEPRLPLVAPCDRPRIMQLWAGPCGGTVPRECSLPFATVRGLTPQQFVETLAYDLHVKGVVAGRNFRFGFKAKGTSTDLELLGQKHGLKVGIVDVLALAMCEISGAEAEDCEPGTLTCFPVQVGDAREVSSTRVRRALLEGDVQLVAELTDRLYRLVVDLPPSDMMDPGAAVLDQGPMARLVPKGPSLFFPKKCFLNEPPGRGCYTVLASRFAEVGTAAIDITSHGLMHGIAHSVGVGSSLDGFVVMTEAGLFVSLDNGMPVMDALRLREGSPQGLTRVCLDFVQLFPGSN